MPNELLVILHQYPILPIPIDDVVGGMSSHALDQLRIVFFKELSHLGVAANGAVEVVGDSIWMEGGERFVVIEFF